MGDLVPELATLPPDLVLDGELVAWGSDGLPSFPRLCDRILHRRAGIGISYVMITCSRSKAPRPRQPFRERRAILDALQLDPPALVGDGYDDGESPFEVVCDRGMEGVRGETLEQPLPARAPRLGEGEEPELLEAR